MEELKNCPFCDGPAHLIKDFSKKENLTTGLMEQTENERYWVKCAVCQASSWFFWCAERAINHWNTRT